MPLATDIALALSQTPITAGGITKTMLVIPSGQVAAAAYATGDAIGNMFEIPNCVRIGPRSAVLHSAHLLDRSDQGIAVDVVFFSAPFTAAVDNAAFAPTDTDMLYYVGALSFSTFKDYGGNQTSDLTGIGMAFNLAEGVGTTGTSLYGQLVSRGAPTVTAGGEYGLSLTFLLD